MPTIPPLVISEEERAELQRRVRAHTTPQRAAKRARIVLLAADGVPNRQIAPMVGMNQHTVAQWRRRFEVERLAGLTDRKRPGRPLVYDHDQRLRIVATVTQQPPTRPATGAIRSWPRNWWTWGSPPPRSAGPCRLGHQAAPGAELAHPSRRSSVLGAGRRHLWAVSGAAHQCAGAECGREDRDRCPQPHPADHASGLGPA